MHFDSTDDTGGTTVTWRPEATQVTCTEPSARSGVGTPQFIVAIISPSELHMAQLQNEASRELYSEHHETRPIHLLAKLCLGHMDMYDLDADGFEVGQARTDAPSLQQRQPLITSVQT